MAYTIFALSSGRPPSGVAVIRISGPKSRSVLEAVCGQIPPARQMALRSMRDADGALIDSGLVCWMPGPDNFTGEDAAELFPHGGPAVVAALLERLGSLDGLRPAEPGEFTRRAVLNGRLDLIEAEALADLVSAETEAQRRFALSLKDGPQRTLYDGWRARLIRMRAMIEAEFDFSEEDDIPEGVSGTVSADGAKLLAEIEDHLDGYRSAEIIRDGFRVVIGGAPNSGKSSLLNALAKRDVALVSPVPGTTRDVVEVSLAVAGYKVLVSDTAGLRETRDLVERMGVARARDRLRDADLVLWLLSVGVQEAPEPDIAAAPTIYIQSKADLALNTDNRAALLVSSVTGAGLGALLDLIAERVAGSVTANTSMMPARARHVSLLQSAATAIKDAFQPDLDLELRAEALRHASDEIGKISGVIATDDLLDVIFREFCVGK